MSSEFNPHNILEDVIISNIYIIIPFIKKYRDVTTRIETEKLFFNIFFYDSYKTAPWHAYCYCFVNFRLIDNQLTLNNQFLCQNNLDFVKFSCKRAILY